MKRKIIEQVIEKLKIKQILLEKEADLAQEEANFHKGKMESRYDTFKEESQYKVDIYRSKAGKINSDISLLKDICRKLSDSDVSIVIASIVTVSGDSGDEVFMILPCGGGEIVNINDIKVQIVSLNSPLGRNLLNSELYDEIKIDTGYKEIKLEIIDVK